MERELNSRITFSISPVGDVQKINPTLSKARVRIFYTGLNRNLTYITKEFADKLLSTLPYSPVGGIWDQENKDFTDHGLDREQFVAYGVVPENPNVQWEDHLDKDGVLRNYACCDIFLWTARYEAARALPGKAQSMELCVDSAKGEWKRDGAVEYFEFTDGCFLGLTALGQDVEPCFEGAAFYNLTDATNLIKELKNYNFSATNEIIGGTETMDEEKIEQVQEEPVVENEADAPEAEETVETVEEVATENELETEETEETETEAEDVPAETEEVEEVEEAEEVTETEETEVETEDGAEGEENETTEDFESKYVEAQARIKELEAQVEELQTYKLEQEKAQKSDLIDKYAEVLPQEKTEEFKENIDTYTLNSLKSEIALAVVNANEDTLFNKATKEVLKDVEGKPSYSGAAALMAKYFKEED